MEGAIKSGLRLEGITASGECPPVLSSHGLAGFRQNSTIAATFSADRQPIFAQASGHRHPVGGISIRNADFTYLATWARFVYVDLIEQLITIENAKIQIVGDGTLAVAQPNIVTVNGQVEFAISRGVTLERKLNVFRFKDWLATASISRRLLRPSDDLPQSDSEGSTAPTSADHVSAPHAIAAKRVYTPAIQGAERIKGPDGLTIVHGFISPEEEGWLVATIDALEWDQSMKRRVQHYGWRYDYMARKVTPANFLGPLPAWADELARRLLASGVVRELPDQVIVNNYDGKQGISKHIDCKDCFRGPIVTVSLLETWEMVFTRKLAGVTAKFVRPLPRCSAAVRQCGSAAVRQCGSAAVRQYSMEMHGPSGNMRYQSD